MSRFVAISSDGQVEVHAASTAANYSTLCAMDGDDPGVGQEPTALPKGARITCPDCIRTILEARAFRKTDIAKWLR